MRILRLLGTAILSLHVLFALLIIMTGFWIIDVYTWFCPLLCIVLWKVCGWHLFNDYRPDPMFILPPGWMAVLLFYVFSMASLPYRYTMPDGYLSRRFVYNREKQSVGTVDKQNNAVCMQHVLCVHICRREGKNGQEHIVLQTRKQMLQVWEQDTAILPDGSAVDYQALKEHLLHAVPAECIFSGLMYGDTHWPFQQDAAVISPWRAAYLGSIYLRLCFVQTAYAISSFFLPLESVRNIGMTGFLLGFCCNLVLFRAVYKSMHAGSRLAAVRYCLIIGAVCRSRLGSLHWLSWYSSRIFLMNLSGLSYAEQQSLTGAYWIRVMNSILCRCGRWEVCLAKALGSLLEQAGGDISKEGMQILKKMHISVSSRPAV